METPGLFELQVDGVSSGFLSETSRWAKFLSILGFIGCGFMALFGLSVMALGSASPMLQSSLSMSGFGAAALGVFYIVFALISIIPYVYLYQFSVKMKDALRSSDQEVLNTSFSKLKSLFKFVGILSIIMMAFFVLAFIGGIMGGLMASR